MREGLSKERQASLKNKKDKEKYLKDLKMEKGIRDEIGTVMNSLKNVN